MRVPSLRYSPGLHLTYGSSHSDQNNSIARQIWLWCIQHHIWLSAAHIAGSRNVETGFQFRSVDFSKEWKLDTQKLRRALPILQFTPSTDIFASRTKCQFPRYVADNPYPGCMAVDASRSTRSHWRFMHFLHSVWSTGCYERFFKSKPVVCWYC